MLENLTPCKECSHYAICRVTDTYIDTLKSLGEVATTEAADVKVRCKYFNHVLPSVKRTTFDTHK